MYRAWFVDRLASLVRWWPSRDHWIDFVYEATVTESGVGPTLSGLPPKERRRQLAEVASGTFQTIWFQGQARGQQLHGEVRIRPGLLHFRQAQINPVIFNCRQPVLIVGEIRRKKDLDLNGGWIGGTRWLHLQCGDTQIDLVVSDFQADHIARAIRDASARVPSRQATPAPRPAAATELPAHRPPTCAPERQ